MTPDEHTIQELHVDVGDGHSLYVQEWGNAKAETPIVSLHGGPGGKSKLRHRQVFDPHKQRVIFFDQRGCGNSTPLGSLEHNTTDDLIGDITKIADRLGIKQFALTGNSWGSCLALAYALRQPERVTGLVLSGVFTGSATEINWLDHGKFQTFFPDAWQRYLDATPAEHHDNPSAYHFARILGDDPVAAKASAYAYENLEGAVCFLDDRFEADDFETYDPTGITIEVAYMANGCFLPDNHILDNADRLTMPIWLVQGRYDTVCPPVTAWRLSQTAPNCELIWTISGHAAERESWNVIRTLLKRWGV